MTLSTTTREDVLTTWWSKALLVTEALNSEALERVLTALFPGALSEQCLGPVRTEYSPSSPVTKEELAAVMKKMMTRNIDPGLDGVPGQVRSLDL